MQLQQNTILITGGSSGIGFELARILIEKNNTVLVCGRSAQKLQAAKASLPELHIFPCDISIPAHRTALFNWVKERHPACNMLVNNAGIAYKTDFRTDDEMIAKAEEEIQTNLVAPIVLSKLFLPLLERNRNAAICNITTGLIYAPRAVYPVYNATKAGLHSFTQVLRHQLKHVPVKVIEVIMTVVDTPWHKGSAPKAAISVEAATRELVAGLAADKQEIMIGKVKLLHFLSRLSPQLAWKIINRL